MVSRPPRAVRRSSQTICCDQARLIDKLDHLARQQRQEADVEIAFRFGSRLVGDASLAKQFAPFTGVAITLDPALTRYSLSTPANCSTTPPG